MAYYYVGAGLEKICVAIRKQGARRLLIADWPRYNPTALFTFARLFLNRHAGRSRVLEPLSRETRCGCDLCRAPGSGGPPYHALAVAMARGVLDGRAD